MIPTAMQDRLEAADNMILNLRCLFPGILTGSPIGSAFVIGCTPKDIDLWLLLSEDYTWSAFEADLERMPELRFASSEERRQGDPRSYRLGDYNLVVTRDAHKYGRGLLAHDLCRAMMLNYKPDRILVFDVIRDTIHPSEARQRWLNNIDMGVE